jgi:glutathione S-transferase
MLTLYIGNKNYSSWSMRPWVLLKQAGIPFEERMVRFDSFDADSPSRRGAQGQPGRPVPVLVDDGLAVWDSLAIAEYVAEKVPRQGSCGRATRRRAPGRAASAPRCIRASARCAPLRHEHRGALPQVGAWSGATRRPCARRRAHRRHVDRPAAAARRPDAVRRVQHRRRVLRAGVHAPAHYALPVPAAITDYVAASAPCRA